MNIETYAPLIAAGLASAAVMLFISAIMRMTAGRGRVRKMQQRITNTPQEATAASRGVFGNVVAKAAAGADRIGEHLSPSKKEELEEANLSMVRAGLSNPARANRIFWGVKGGLVLIGLIAASFVFFVLRIPAPPAIMALMFIFPMVVGMYVPNIWLHLRTSGRRTAITNALPDALDLLVVCVESGMGLDQALSRIAREMSFTNPELAGELNTVILELRAGKTRTDALKNLARRVGIEDMNSLVTLIVQADTFGTSIATTLRVYSDHMRTTRYQRAEEIAAKLPVKMLFPLIFFILPALFVAIMGPAGIQLMRVFQQL
ncbi:type II secretion system F family protein [Desulfovibrio mangrovi]|uniref:type II secretion system F family protein n=1 Tax=Desulfovibrio mangrovi TaxID=2976983 RepID=UPI002245C2F0|nr:type II secretion system F family protein [Desulfovibrio mangrovi]UZP65906.1 type II secretion system F family protein [Desulfovibrio mangrovi]